MEIAELGEETFRRTRLSQSELDEEARAFALVLIGRWILDPSNVRLLRVALDLCPSRQLIDSVLKDRKSVAWGKSVSVRVDLVGSRILQQQKYKQTHITTQTFT